MIFYCLLRYLNNAAQILRQGNMYSPPLQCGTRIYNIGYINNYVVWMLCQNQFQVCVSLRLRINVKFVKSALEAHEVYDDIGSIGHLIHVSRLLSELDSGILIRLDCKLSNLTCLIRLFCQETVHFSVLLRVQSVLGQTNFSLPTS